MERQFMTDKISYIPASEAPLSADIVIIEGKEHFYVFDVGADEKNVEFLNSLPKEKIVILSHFHPDHIGNIGKVDFLELYAGANTAKYLNNYLELPENVTEEDGNCEFSGQDMSHIVEKPLTISDGISLTIFPMPSSHAKGSLALEVNETYLFLGDATYCTMKNGKAVYNAGLLKEQTELLRKSEANYLCLSHNRKFVQEKEEVLRELEEIYARRSKNEPYIEAGE